MTFTSSGPETNLRKTDITFVLKPKEGGATSTTGLVDRRLFTGANKLHAVMDLQTSLWRLKYEQGILPVAFHQQFTSFEKLHIFVRNYFDNRNVEIVSIVD